MNTNKLFTLAFSLFFIVSFTHAQQLEDYVQKNSSGKVIAKGKTRSIQQSDKTDCLGFNPLISQGKIKMGTWTFYYDDGTVMMEGNFVNNVPVGYWYANHPNGKKYFDGIFENNKKYCEKRKCPLNIITIKDVYNLYWEDGLLSTKCYDLNTETIKCEFVNPKIQETITKNQYLLTGNKYLSGIDFEKISVFEYDASGKIEETFYRSIDFNKILNNYMSYTRADEWKSYYPNKKLNEIGEYNPFTNKPDGEWISFYEEDGNMKSKGVFDNGKKSGIWIYYAPNNILSSKQEMKDGINHGICEFYYESGILKSKGTYLNDKKNGLWESYFTNKKLKSKEMFKDDKRDGIYEEFYENGILNAKGNYVNDMKDGLWEYYFTNNNLRVKETFKNGNKEGLRVFYFENGSLNIEENFWNGVIVNANFYYPSGKILCKRTFFNGEVKDLNEQDIYFSENGEEILKNGTGKKIVYRDNGTVSFEANYANGCRDGMARWYYDNGQVQKEVMYRFSENHKPMGLRWEVISTYDRNGSPREKGTLKNGNGTWINYDDNNLATVDTYKNGVLVEN